MPLIGSLTPAQPGSIVSATPVDLYVDATNGNDANDGSSAHPFQTIPKAIATLPVFYATYVRLHLSADTFTMPNSFVWNLGAPFGTVLNSPDTYAIDQGGVKIRLIGTYATQFTGSITSFATVGGYMYQLNDTGQSWTAHALEGMILHITSGAAIGRKYRIRANTATQVEVLASYSLTNPANGDTYVIEKPSTIIQARNWGLYGIQSAGVSGLEFTGIEFQMQGQNGAGAGGYLYNFGQNIRFNGCTFTFNPSGACLFALSGAAMSFGLPASSSSWTDLDDTITYKLGLYVTGTGTLTITTFSQTVNQNYLILRNNASLAINNRSQVSFASLDLSGGGGITLAYNSVLQLVSAQQAGFTAYQISGATSGTGAIQVTKNSSLEITQACTINSSTGPAIYADTFSTVLLTGAVTGTLNARGLSLQHCAKSQSSSTVTVTGSSGDVICGATTGTWAGINGGTAVTEAKSQTAAVPT